MGSIMDEHGVHVNIAKLKVIRNWPTLMTLIEIDSFLGLSNFYCRIILGFSYIIEPISQVTKHGDEYNFVWAKSQ